jgi:dTDP-4-amino-4,6-dideoxygalactose transaminase
MGISRFDASGVDPADFCRFDPVPEEGIARAVAIMRSGEIFRYSGGSSDVCEVAHLEREIAAYVGAQYALAVNSCSKAILLALAACGVGAGSKVLIPAFTFTAVPSAIVLLGAEPVFVECLADYRIDTEDLRKKITAETSILLLSHMRGYISDMDAVTAICDEHKVVLIEDAAHALGARWRNKSIGSIGKIGCFSFQSNKIINTGEGGVIVTDDEQVIVKSILLSGAYEGNWQKHGVQSNLFDKFRNKFPLHNARMTNVTAAMARPQIALIDVKGVRYREMLRHIKAELASIEIIEFAEDSPHELRIPDSLQIRLRGFDNSMMNRFLAAVRKMGVPMTGFFEHDNARSYQNWHYVEPPQLPQTFAAISNACDMRLSSSLTHQHTAYIASVIRTAVHEVQLA